MGRKLVQLFVKKSHYRNPTWETVMWQPHRRIEGEKRLRWVHLWWFIAHQLPSLIPHNLHSQPPHLFAQEWESFRIQWTRTWTDRNWKNVMISCEKGWNSHHGIGSRTCFVGRLRCIGHWEQGDMPLVIWCGVDWRILQISPSFVRAHNPTTHHRAQRIMLSQTPIVGGSWWCRCIVNGQFDNFQAMDRSVGR